MAMTSDAKRALSSTIRGLRQRLLDDLKIASESAYRLSVRAQDAGLDEAARTKRKRLDSWLDEQVRAQTAGGRRRERVDFLREAEQQAAYTLLNRLVILRLMEEPAGPSDQPLRKPALIKGGWNSRAYQDFRDLARGVVRDDPTEGFGFLLQLVCEELAEDLPGLFGSAGIADLIPIPAATLRHAVEELNKEELQSCWSDDMTLGWVYQYWNDPERERLDAKINDGGKIEPHEIASKTQMFTERYMVDWMLQNSLGLMWFTLCKKNGWTPEVEANGTLQRLEERRIEWRAKRAAGEVSLTELMPLETEEERRWAYFLPEQEIPDEAVELAPDSVREWKILDPAVGSGHFLVVALGLLLALFQEEARHRGLQDAPEWSERAIVEHLLAHTLHGIDIDPRAVQIAAASLWLKGKSLCPEMEPEQLNLVAPNLRLADLPDDDQALVELRSDIEAETGIAGEFTHQILQALRGADHLGSLLKIDQAIEKAIQKQEEKIAWLREPKQQELLQQAGAMPDKASIEFDELEARATIQDLLDRFLGRHTSASDLGLRLKGEQLASGIRFVRSLAPGSYDLVIANPPYQGNGKIFDTQYIEGKYILGKADLYASFLLQNLDLVKPAGLSGLLSPRDWMFAQQYTALRESVLANCDLNLLADLGWGAFREIKDVRVCMSIWRKIIPASLPTVFLAPTGVKPSGRTMEDYEQKVAGLQLGIERFSSLLSKLSLIKEWPITYWWDDSMIDLFGSCQPLGERCPVRNGLSTQDNTRFLRLLWEVKKTKDCARKRLARSDWALYIKGAAGRAWFEDAKDVIRWAAHGMEVKVFNEAMYGSYSRTVKNEKHYFERGVAFSLIGDRFTARIHRYSSIFGHMGASVFPGEENLESICCILNSSKAQDILSSLNPGVHFLVGDVNRIPFLRSADRKPLHALSDMLLI